MMDQYRVLGPVCLASLLATLSACSSSSGGGASGGGASSTALELDNGSIETCYDVQISYAGTNQLKNVCTTREFGAFNGLGVNRYLRLSLPQSLPANTTVTVNVNRTSGLDPADPDLVLYRQGEVVEKSDTEQFNTESLSVDLAPGDYVVVLNEYVYVVSGNGGGVNRSNQSKQTRALARSSQKPVSSGNIQVKSDSTCDTTDEVTVSGFALFERVKPVSVSTASLDYINATIEPVQQARVEVICDNGVYSATQSAADGSYTLAFPVNQQSVVRVKAQMLKTSLISGSDSEWDFSVVDNTTPGQPVYAMDSSPFTAVATVNLTNKNLLAESGWDNAFLRYTDPRVAAPFAILDSVRKAKDKVLVESPTLSFPALKLNWSVSNTTSPFGDLTSGAIESSFFDGEQIYLLGAADNDTDEYDEHVIIHEWGHYFEDFFSRSDSIGGTHTTGDILDIRIIFGEGFANALSSIITDDPLYIDTSGGQQSRGFIINMENNNCLNAGWYSECSVQSILYDIYDADNDASDTLSLGFTPIFNVLPDAQKNTPALVSIFTFITALKGQNPASATAVNALTSEQGINPILDIYGGSQFSNNPGSTDLLPIYLPF